MDGPVGFPAGHGAERRGDGAGGAAEPLLQLALAEISQCYESLAAFYRLGDAVAAECRIFLRRWATLMVNGAKPTNAQMNSVKKALIKRYQRRP